MPQGISRRPLTAECRVQSQANTCGICGNKVVLGHIFLAALPLSDVTIIPAMFHPNSSFTGTT
jgi:hypothetical protein